MNLGCSARWCCDAGENFQQRAFTGAVQTDDANNLTAFDFKRNVAERPDVSVAVLRRVFETPERSTRRVRDRIAKRLIALERADAVLLAKIFAADCEVGH